MRIEPKQGENAAVYDITSQVDRQVTLVSIDKLTPYAGNARTHSKKQIEQIAASIGKFGFNNPVLVNDEGQIVAGHGRVEAAKLLGLAAVPTLRLSHLSPAQQRAYVLADNKLAEKAGWDRELLATELQDLIEIDFDIGLTGFDLGEIDLILNDADEARREEAGDEDDIPLVTAGTPVTLPGDLWILNKHRLLCGDACDTGAYGVVLGDEKAQFVFTDPPYNVPIEGNVSRGSIQYREFAMGSGEMTPEAFVAFLQTVFRNLTANSTDGSLHEICMDWRHLAEILQAGRRTYSELMNICVWAKSHPGMGSFYRSQHEFVFIWKAGDGPHINNLDHGKYGRTRGNVWSYPGLSSMQGGRKEQLAMHPTVKPVALVADAIKDASHRNGIILDAFSGSGTTIIAAERTGRRARAIEIDPTYVDVAVKRWQNLTGKAAMLAGTDKAFAEVAEQRGASNDKCATHISREAA